MLSNSTTSGNDKDTRTDTNVSKDNGDTQDMSKQSVVTEPTQTEEGIKALDHLRKSKQMMAREWMVQQRGWEEEEQ